MEKKKIEQIEKLFKEREEVSGFVNWLEGWVETKGDDTVIVVGRGDLTTYAIKHPIPLKEYPYILDALKRCYFDAMAKKMAIDQKLESI